MFASACDAPAPPFAGREWQVVAIGAHQAPFGAGGRPLTMNFDAAESRVSGFAGCNQYGGPYVQSGDTLIFGPMVSTKMFCLESDSVERAFLGAIPAVATWQLQDSVLILHGAGVAIRLREGQH
jgi:heat shock protein HslJ